MVALTRFSPGLPAARTQFPLSGPDCPFTARQLALDFPPPRAELRASVVVPARNEQTLLPTVIEALARQCDPDGQPLAPSTYEVLLLLNNCTDGTADVARALRRQFPQLVFHLAEIQLAAGEAHVGRARQALFDTALARFGSLDRPDGLILTTDADSRPAPDWIAQNEAEIATGVDGVGGRITLFPTEEKALPAGVRRMFLLDIGYRRALEEMHSLYAPETHDPFPRHHQHFGGSMSVTAAAYARAGGMPLRRSNEDVGLYRAVLESGGRFRHSYRVRVETSARIVGRAEGGLADAIQWWNCQASDAAPVLVESALAAEARLAQLGMWCAHNPGQCPPTTLAFTPEPPPAGTAAELQLTLRSLRELNARLRAMPFEQRIESARQRFGNGLDPSSLTA